MKNKFLLFTFITLLSFSFYSCKDEEELSNLTGFLSFEFTQDIIKDYKFTIDESNVITNATPLPYGFDATKLAPVFTVVPKAMVYVNSVEQISGETSQDFSSNVIYSVIAEDGKTTKEYTVKLNIAKEISSWTRLVADTKFPNYKEIKAFTVGDKFFITGGNHSGQDFNYFQYSSSDGATWELVTDSLFKDKGIGVGHATVNYKGKVLLIGGRTYMNWADWSTGKAFNSVFESSNGTDWTNLTKGAQEGSVFTPRTDPMVTVLGDDIYLFGGSDLAFGNPAASLTKQDVWKSSDGGKTWTKLNNSLPKSFVPRLYGALISVNNELILMGGKKIFTKEYFNDIYKSKDGVTWTKINVTAPFPPRAKFVTFVNQNRIFVIGGLVATEVGGKIEDVPANDTWVSEDFGVTWKKVTKGTIDFAPRYGSASFVNKDNSVFIIGGIGVKPNEEEDAPIYKDVWKGVMN